MQGGSGLEMALPYVPRFSGLADHGLGGGGCAANPVRSEERRGKGKEDRKREERPPAATTEVRAKVDTREVVWDDYV